MLPSPKAGPNFQLAIDLTTAAIALDPEWAGPTISTTGYLFAAMFYFVFCFGMSRYSLAMERRLAAGRNR